mmetsp:Transcript_19527/g.49291  ORF Transcript_19527/g.49291 Transcript_19527/m.49291 type:complete len:329 (-) Transcript_19527:354-1340(-)
MAGTLMQTLLCAPTALLHSATALARRFVVWALKGGAIPQHVAFIMDGNRRFAVRNCMSRAQGHREGYDRLVDALQWCLDLGINYVTVYAFSIENFKRPESEVDDIMDLAADKLEEILQERDLVRRHGVQVRVIGELQLLPPKVQLAAARVMSATQSHTRGVLNICFSYTQVPHTQCLRARARILRPDALQPLTVTLLVVLRCRSQHEISAAAEAVARGISCELIHEEDVRRALIYESLHTAGCPPVDLLVRTSGETRLSDFMLCQANHAILEFTSVFWPEFGFFNLLVSIVRFQLLSKNHHGKAIRAISQRRTACAEFVQSGQSCGEI